MAEVVQSVIDAVDLGSLYAILALGIALIFGIMGLINFAHGELIMIGGYVLFLLTGPPFVLALIGMIVVVVAAALIMERVAFRPVRAADPSTMLVTSFAVSIFLQNAGVVSFGSVAKSVSLPGFLRDSWFVGDVQIRVLTVLTIGVTFALLVAVAAFFKRTMIGVQMRAAAEDFQTARLVGVKANRVIAMAFAMSGVLAGVAAFLLIAGGGSVDPTIGQFPVIVAFIATIIGRMGSLTGAVIGGYLLGAITVILQVALPLELRPYRDSFVFTAVIAVLLFRPEGLVQPRRMVKRTV